MSSLVNDRHPSVFQGKVWGVFYILSWEKICDLLQKKTKSKQTNKQKSSVQPWAEVLSFTHSISPRQSIWTRTRQADALWWGLSELTWQNPFWRAAGADITWQTPARSGQELFTQTVIAVSIKGEQEKRYVREVNHVWKVWREKRRERFWTQHEIMKIWWSAAPFNHVTLHCRNMLWFLPL